MSDGSPRASRFRLSLAFGTVAIVFPRREHWVKTGSKRWQERAWRTSRVLISLLRTLIINGLGGITDYPVLENDDLSVRMSSIPQALSEKRTS